MRPAIVSTQHRARFEIRFQYDKEPQAHPTETRCILTVIYNDGGLRVLVGTAMLSSKDKFCYETGRKVALTKAMASLSEFETAMRLGLAIKAQDGGFRIDHAKVKALRTELWTEYLDRNCEATRRRKLSWWARKRDSFQRFFKLVRASYVLCFKIANT